MRITWQEVRYLEEFFEHLESYNRSKANRTPEFKAYEDAPWNFFADHPEYLMAMNFDEFVSFRNHREFERFWYADSRTEWEPPNCVYRQPAGQWLLFFTPPVGLDGSFDFHSKATLDLDADDEFALRISARELFDRLYDIADRWVPDRKEIWHPKLWTSAAQQEEKSLLESSIHAILTAIHQEQLALADIGWRQFEELVAEVLRMQELEVHLVRESPQGGRDILARGELIPGQEPITMAVEVKHKEVVDRPDVQTALWQNRHFPALLFVTSGRFTSGVLEEKNLDENRFRLFLKDGAALGDLIRDYHLIGRTRLTEDS
jgi:hypothetical protein